MICISLTSHMYWSLVPLSYRKKLYVALFKNWINLLETKNDFFTYLPSFSFLAFFLFFLFFWLLTGKIPLLSNIFTFGNWNKKFQVCIFLYLNLLAIAFWCFLFKSLKTVHLYVMKSNCCIYSYIPNYSFFISYFWFTKKTKKTLESNGSPVSLNLALRNPSLLRVKTNGIFKTSLLSFQYWLLGLV